MKFPLWKISPPDLTGNGKGRSVHISKVGFGGKSNWIGLDRIGSDRAGRKVGMGLDRVGTEATGSRGGEGT